MVDQFKNYEDVGRENNHLRRYIIVIAIIFGVSAYFNPEHVWPLLIALLVCVAAIIYLKSSDVRKEIVLDHKTQDQKAEAGIAAVLGSLQYPAYILDHRGAVKFANATSSEIFGKFNIGDLVSIRFRQPELNKFIEEALRTREPMRTNYSEPGPHDRWFAVDLAPIKAPSDLQPDDEPLFLLGFHDLTDAKRTEQTRTDFIANASHELRTPIASLLGYIETIRGAAKNDKKATERFLGIMQDQAERMTRLVNDLLSLSRIEMKSHVRPSEQVDISNIVQTVVHSLDELARQMNVEIHYNAPEEIWIIGDQDELIQVFENLIENACKYGEEGERVDVTLKKNTTRNQAYVTFSVRDYGQGVAIEDQHRITERFYRVDVARSREKQGTGLGLAIVKHILNRHQVRLNVKSKLGEGAEFSMTFPIAENVLN